MIGRACLVVFRMVYKLIQRVYNIEMPYRIFEKTLGKQGVRIALENGLVFPITYRDILNKDGESVYDGNMQGGHVDQEAGEAFKLGDRLVIVSGAVKENEYYEIVDSYELPYINMKLETELPEELRNVPLSVILPNYAGMIPIQVRALTDADL
jgi:hypothetical protein